MMSFKCTDGLLFERKTTAISGLVFFSYSSVNENTHWVKLLENPVLFNIFAKGGINHELFR